MRDNLILVAIFLVGILVGRFDLLPDPLPFILKISGEKYLVPSLYHGFICDLSVPILVTLFASLA